MINAAVVNFMKCDNQSSIIASNRIARYLAMKSGAVLVDRKEACYPQPYDVIFIVNGAFLFCDFREELKKLLQANKRFVWVGNDYAIEIPSQIRFIKDLDFTVWAAYENFKNYKQYIYTDWNKLTYHGRGDLNRWKHLGVSYFGAFREDRLSDFKKYFGAEVPYPVYVSTSMKGKDKFFELNHKIKFFDAGDVIRSMGAYQSTVYIEDESTHKIYCSPANRFYECLSAGVLQFFDSSTKGTFKRADIEIAPWIVDGPEQLRAALENSDLRERQTRLAEGRDFRAELDAKVSNVLALL